MPIKDIRTQLGIEAGELTGGALTVTSPIDGAVIGNVTQTIAGDLDPILDRSMAAFRAWRLVPAPQRGELIRLFGDELRAHKEPLGKLVSIESGKILTEGLGEVQEMIDICDFAVGLSRQLYGLTISSERPRPPYDGNLAPAGSHGSYYRVQFSRCCLGLELCHCAGLRQFGGMEAVGKDADFGNGL
jgi:aldehyde dehydrogenase (NAD+)